MRQGESNRWREGEIERQRQNDGNGERKRENMERRRYTD